VTDLDPAELTVALDRSLSVASGSQARARILVTNRSAQPLSISTNGCLTAVIVDPATGREVGGSARPQLQPGVTFVIAPGATEAIVLVVGTDRLPFALGQAIEPGPWALRVIMTTTDGRRLASPLLPVTVTD
jgi:hypothetical protein